MPVTGQIDALCEVWEPMSSDSGLEGVCVFAVGLFDGVDVISFSACDLNMYSPLAIPAPTATSVCILDTLMLNISK